MIPTANFTALWEFAVPLRTFYNVYMRIRYIAPGCALLALALSAAVYFLDFPRIPVLQQNNLNTEGKTFQYYYDVPSGFTVEIPDGFALYDIERSYEKSSFALGDVEMFETAGYDGQWFINVFDVDDAGYVPWSKNHIATEHDVDSIRVNGMPALRRRSTSTRIPDWELVEVAVRRGERVYVIHNGGRNEAGFEKFYNSFTLENDNHN
jgi:hypothetical protein